MKILLLRLTVIICLSAFAFGQQIPSGQAPTTVTPSAGAVFTVTWPSALPVTVDNASLAVTGTFWQSTQPVSGTFWQATQPVSIASMPSTPVTGTFWQTTQPVSGTFWQATQPVSFDQTATNNDVDANITNTSLAVTGTFWQATQPVSAVSLPLPTGASTEATLTTLLKPGDTLTGLTNLVQLNGQAVSMGTGLRDAGTQRVTVATNDSVPVTGTFWQATQPVSGTFWQATQPISGTVTANQGTAAAGSGAWPTAITNTSDVIVKPGDSVNNAMRVNVVAGGAGDGKILDGTAAGEADVLGSAPGGTEQGLIVRNIPSGTQTISGTVTANAGTGTLLVDTEASLTGSSLNVNCTGGCGSAATSNLVNLSVSESVAAPTAATWYLKHRWLVPSGVTFLPSRIWSSATTAGSRTLVAAMQKLGSFNASTNVFTDGGAAVAPHFYGKLIIVVTTAFSATADTLTITYTNQDGTTDKTSTCVAVAASAPVGNAFECNLAVTSGQMRDPGIRDVTAVSDSAAPTGIVDILGVNPLHQAQAAANAYEVSDYDAGELIAASEEIIIAFYQAATTAQMRGAGIVGSIR